ncbi:MAG: FecR family protein [Opitutaceae bacterium]
MTPLPKKTALTDDAIETAAAEWLCERDEGFAPGRAQAFAAWRAADPRHEAAVAETERAMEIIAEMPAVRAPLEARIAEVTQPVAPVVRWGGFRPPVWAMGLAAALALAAGVWWLVPSRSVEPQRYVTAAARQQQIALKDGSVVNLNVSSEVSVRLTAKERRVTLASGEAHFAVAHDTARPFIVTAAGVSVRAVGTAFSVRMGEAGVEVLVTEGKVEVTRDAAPTGVGAAVSRAVVPPQLVAGQRALIAREASVANAPIERVSAEVLSAAVRWHSEVMTFSDLPLREAVVLFNRRNETQLVLVDDKLGTQKIGGTFAADQVEAFVRLLEKDGDVVVERRGAREIALRRAP